MDIVRERLEREYDLELMATMPSVEFEVTLTDGAVIPVHNPTDMPDPARIAEVREPYIRALDPHAEGVHRADHGALPGAAAAPTRGCTTSPPSACSSPTTCRSPRSCSTSSTSSRRARAATRRWTTSRSACGPSNLVKLDVLLGGDPVDALSMVVHRDKAYEQGKQLTERLRKKIPRQQYDVPIQAAVGAKIIARETVKAFRKDVTAKCYGGDISRKRKLLERQKEGKKRMKQVGRIEVPAGGVPRGARARRTTDEPRDTYARRPREDPRVRARDRGDRRDLPRRRGRAGRRLRRRRRAADVRRGLLRGGRWARRCSTPRSASTSPAWSTARQDFTWHAPVVAGDEITTEAAFVETGQARRASRSSRSLRARSTSAASSSARGHGRTS